MKKHSFKLCAERPDLCEEWGCKCICHKTNPKTQKEAGKKYPFKVGKLKKGFSVWEQVLWDNNKPKEGR